MARFLFVSAPLPGHLDWGGYLATAAALQARGHAVLWASGKDVAGMVTAAGVPFAGLPTVGWQMPPPLPDDLAADVRGALRSRRALASWLDVEEVLAGWRALCDLARDWRAEAIVGELFVTAAPLAAETLDLPYLVCGWPAQRYAAPAGGPAAALAETAWQRLQALWQASGTYGRFWGRDGAFWPLSPYGHVVYFSRAWYGELPLLPQTHFVGGMARAPQGRAPAWWDELPVAGPLVLLTLGSLFAGDANFFITLSHAVAAAGGHSIIASGRGAGSEGLRARIAPRLPAAVTVRAWVDYDWLLPRLALLAHHGGMGTTHAAIVHGLPQLVIPHAGDQALQARRVVQAGVGLQIAPAQASLETVTAAVRSLLVDAAWRSRAEALQAAFARLGGPPFAAQVMEQVIDKVYGR